MAPRALDPRAPAALVRLDPTFGAMVKRAPRPQTLSSITAFHYLARAILYQQLATAAANTIYRRLVGSFDRRPFPSPADLAGASTELLRAAGVSSQKERYLRDLAAHFTDGRLRPRRLIHMDDDAVRAEVMQVLGIGRWTADVFLLFWLARPDVLPANDLGIQKGVQILRDLPELPTAAEVSEIGVRWAPYRSTAAWYLWRTVDG